MGNEASTPKQPVIRYDPKTIASHSKSTTRILESTRDATVEAGDASSIQRVRLTALLSHPENAQCADCAARVSPATKPWAVLNAGVFICIECSGVHRSMGVHVSQVRHVFLDNWTPEQVDVLAATTNVKANEALEYHVPADVRKPAASATREEREVYIQAKYAERLFVKEKHEDESPLPPVYAEEREQVDGGKGGADDASGMVEARAGDAGAAGAGGVGMIQYTGVLKVTLLEGSNLPAKDVTGKSDPYVVLYNSSFSQQVKSKMKEQTLDPVWNETLMLTVEGTKDPCFVSVWDFDRMSYDDFMGHGVILLEGLEDGATHDVWVNLIDHDGQPLKEGGKVHLLLQYEGFL